MGVIIVKKPYSLSGEIVSEFKHLAGQHDQKTHGRWARGMRKPGARQVIDDPDFKAWFGKSKVVNPDGTPRVVYHGTLANFATFEPTKNPYASVDQQIGPHFADDPNVASRFGMGVYNTNVRPESDRALGGNVMPVYLRVEKPRVIKPLKGRFDQYLIRRDAADVVFEERKDLFSDWMKSTSRGYTDEQINTVYDKLKRRESITKADTGGTDYLDKDSDYAKDDGNYGFGMWFTNLGGYGWKKQPEFAEEYKRILKKKGYDGIVYHNTAPMETGEVKFDIPEEQSWWKDPQQIKLPRARTVKTYIVFDNKQIKSALGNQGTFDPQNPDITKELRNYALKHLAGQHDQSTHGSWAGGRGDITQTPEFKKWFGDSKVVDKDGKPLVVYHGTPTRPSESNNKYIRALASETGDKEYPEFEAFKPDIHGYTDSGWLGRGTYFTPDSDFAFEFGNYIIPVYLKVEKPFVIKDDGYNTAENVYNFRKSLAELDGIPEDLKYLIPNTVLKENNLDELKTKWGRNPSGKYYDEWIEENGRYYWLEKMKGDKDNWYWGVVSAGRKGKEQGWGSVETRGATPEAAVALWNDKLALWSHKDYSKDLTSPGFVSTVITQKIGSKRFSDILKQNGFDGVMSYDVSHERPPRLSEILVFDPTQIKSTFNQGTFDPTDPRILKEKHDTAMICFDAGSVAKIDIDLPDKTDLVSDRHITLLYLGKVDNLTQSKQEIVDLLKSFASEYAPIDGEFNGLAAFAKTPENDNQSPVVVLYDSPALPGLRHALKKKFDTYNDFPEQTHGFTPHMTLGYTAAPDIELSGGFKPVKVRFDKISLWWGDEHIDFELTGKTVEKSLQDAITEGFKHLRGQHNQKTHGSWAAINRMVAETIKRTRYTEIPDPQHLPNGKFVLLGDGTIIKSSGDKWWQVHHTVACAIHVVKHPEKYSQREISRAKFVLSNRFPEDLKIERAVQEKEGAFCLETGRDVNGENAFSAKVAGYPASMTMQQQVNQSIQKVKRLIKKELLKPGDYSSFYFDHPYGGLSVPADAIDSLRGVTSDGDPIYDDVSMKHLGDLHDQKTHGLWATKKVAESIIGSPDFINWFEGSQVIDSSGSPKVVYHGSNTDFSAFDPEKIGSSTDSGKLGKGFYFSTDPNISRGRIVRKDVFLSLKNPLKLKMNNWGEDKQEKISLALGTNQKINSSEITQRLLSLGYDSVELDYSGLKYNHKEYMVVNPSQIWILSGQKKTIKHLSGQHDQKLHGNWANDIITGIDRDKNFKAWFEGSQVIDDEGKPLVVYHGTRADFTEFRTYNEDSGEIGFHVGNELQAASRGDAIMPLYARIKKPLVVPESTFFDPSLWNIDSYIKLFDKLGYKDIASDLARKWDDIYFFRKPIPFDDRLPTLKKYVQEALKRAGGYDGIKYYNRWEAFHESEKRETGRWSYILFDPAQVKSIHNRGTFDPGDPSILKELTVKHLSGQHDQKTHGSWASGRKISEGSRVYSKIPPAFNGDRARFNAAMQDIKKLKPHELFGYMDRLKGKIDFGKEKIWLEPLQDLYIGKLPKNSHRLSDDFWQERSELMDKYRDQMYLTDDEAKAVLGILQDKIKKRLAPVIKSLNLPDNLQDVLGREIFEVSYYSMKNKPIKNEIYKKIDAWASDLHGKINNPEDYDMEELMYGIFGEFKKKNADLPKEQARNAQSWISAAQADLAERWSFDVNHKFAIGEIDADKKNNWSAIGEVDDKKWVSMPDKLWHVTTNSKAIQNTGLKSRYELGGKNAETGLGGGEDKTISFTDSYETAKQIERALQEAHMVAGGRITADKLIEAAEKGGGGVGKPWLDKIFDGTGSGIKPTSRQTLPRQIKDLLDYEAGKPVKDYHGKVWGREEYLDTLWGWYHIYYMNSRESAGGYMNPVFFGTNWQALAKLDPGEIKTHTYTPKARSRGHKVSGLGEWRTIGGDTVELSKVENLFPADDIDAILGLK